LPELLPPRDYSGLNEQGASLRIWLPEAARLGLENICTRQETSMTVYLTEYFATYLYGLHELLRMRENRLGLYAPQEPPKRLGCAMGSGEPEKEPNLGKNIFALKIFVPDKIKEGLRAHAIKAGHDLGEFTRALICAHLFGREYGPQKLMTWVADEVDCANAWESEVDA
jgi:hypothetical protein